MTGNKSASKPTWVDPDDAPELTDKWFREADLRKGDKVIRRGRPKAASPKKLVSLRLDAEVVERLRASGPRWQSRANKMLRKAVGL